MTREIRFYRVKAPKAGENKNNDPSESSPKEEQHKIEESDKVINSTLTDEPPKTKKQKIEEKEEVEKGNSNDEDNDDKEVEDDLIGVIDVGSSAGWPCFWKPYFVAAYRKLLAENVNENDERLICILNCCPPSSDSVDNSKVPCGNMVHSVSPNLMNDAMSSRMSPLFGFMDGLINRMKRNVVNYKHLFDVKNQLILDTLGLSPIVDLALRFNRCDDLTTSCIRGVSQMMNTYFSYLPLSNEDVANTPYKDADYATIDGDERHEELKNYFAEAASAPYGAYTSYN